MLEGRETDNLWGLTLLPARSEGNVHIMTQSGLHGGWCCGGGGELELSFAECKNGSSGLGYGRPGHGPLESVIILGLVTSDKYRLGETDSLGHLAS